LRRRWPRIELTAGFYRIEAEVAADDREAHAGADASAQHGQPTRACCSSFRRRGTPLHVDAKYASCPLSVAFLDEDGRILNIENMQPQTEENHCAAKAARYALEMNLGWFSSKGIKPGARVGGLEKAPAPR
jgi:uncharacterized membrane protein (UPF0127 family)